LKMGVYTQVDKSPLVYLVLALSIILAGCSLPFANPRPQAVLPLTSTPSPVPSHTPSPFPTLTLTSTPTSTTTPTLTPSLTPTITATPTPSPTSVLPLVTVKEQANCRYGPGTAYLYAQGLYAGDTGVAGGRNDYGTWVWIKPDKTGWYCFAALSVLDVEKGRDIMRLPVSHWPLPHSTFYPPPSNIQATRAGNKVAITWNKVKMTEDDDRGYLIEANICQDGNLVFVAVNPMKPSYVFRDDQDCSSKSSGLLYTVDKHGYSNPVKIRWPR
jgi:hypothetical protein